MNPELIRALAEYFTGPEVEIYGCALRLEDSPAKEHAKTFFIIREKLGLTGYLSLSEAYPIILKQLTDPENADGRRDKRRIYELESEVSILTHKLDQIREVLHDTV